MCFPRIAWLESRAFSASSSDRLDIDTIAGMPPSLAPRSHLFGLSAYQTLLGIRFRASLGSRECDAHKRTPLIYGMGKLGMLPHSGQPLNLLIFYDFILRQVLANGSLPNCWSLLVVEDEGRDVSARASPRVPIFCAQPFHVAEIPDGCASIDQHEHPLIDGKHKYNRLSFFCFGHRLARPCRHAFLFSVVHDGSERRVYV